MTKPIGSTALMTRRAGLKAAALGLAAPLAMAAAPTALGQATPEPQSDGAADRAYLVEVLTRTADPVLEALHDCQRLWTGWRERIPRLCWSWRVSRVLPLCNAIRKFNSWLCLFLAYT